MTYTETTTARRVLHLERADLTPAMRRAADFIGYKGRTFQTVAHETVEIGASAHWYGGSKSTYFGFHWVTGTVQAVQSVADLGDGLQPKRVRLHLSRDLALVERIIACGRDMGVCFHVHPDNLNGLLPDRAALTPDERTVLRFTREYKASYGGISNLRFHKARLETGITAGQWERAKGALIASGHLDKRGAITPRGRNAI